MVKVRLTRMGAKKAPFYRLIATDSRSPRDGRFLEILGYFDPVKQPEVVHIKLDRVDYWLSVGAQLSETAKAVVKRARKLMPAAQA